MEESKNRKRAVEKLEQFSKAEDAPSHVAQTLARKGLAGNMQGAAGHMPDDDSDSESMSVREAARIEKIKVIKNTACTSDCAAGAASGSGATDCKCAPADMKNCQSCAASAGGEGCPDGKSSGCSHESSSAEVIPERYKKLVLLAGTASVVTAVLLIVMKFVVWLFSGSATILASLTDSLIDLGASFINLLALRYALQPADKQHRFGHYKAEALASLSQAAFICGSALLLIFNGYERLMKPVAIGYIDIAIYVSIASIVLTLMLTMFQGYVCKLTQSEAVAADRFHYLSDVGLNLSVIVSLVLTRMGYEWSDGLVTILLGLYIMKSSWHIGHVAVGTLLDKSMSVEDNNKIIRSILAVDGIDSFHDLRTRKAGPQHYIQCHIVIDHSMPLGQAHDLADEAEHNIRRFFPDADISLHMEPDHNETFKDITFIDSQFCQVPVNFYGRSGSASADDTQPAADAAAAASAKAGDSDRGAAQAAGAPAAAPASSAAQAAQHGSASMA